MCLRLRTLYWEAIIISCRNIIESSYSFYLLILDLINKNLYTTGYLFLKFVWMFKISESLKFKLWESLK